MRLVVTRGKGDLGLNPRKCPKCTVFCIAAGITLYPAEVYARARAAGSELLAAVEREGVPLWTMSAERSSARA